MLEHILYLIGGLAALIISGEYLVRGAVGIARKLDIPSMVIGLTVVAFGTSAPELIVSLNAALEGSPEIAIGNVVGSNIANMSFILGLTAVIFPIAVERSSIRIDWPVMMALTIIVFLFMWDGQIARWEGGILFGILVGFIVFLVRGAVSSRKASRKEKENEKSEVSPPEKQLGIPLYLLIVLGALVGMYFGSDYLLMGAVGIAEEAGMPQHVIGVTIVAIGTSVPELVTSVMASLRKQTDISVGNLLGSNVFNIGAVLGITALVKPIPVAQEALDFDMWYVAGLSLALLPILAIRRKIDRLRGVLLFLSYVAYLMVLVLKVTGKL